MEQEKIEELMKPRWLVIADMPFKPSSFMYSIGDILTDQGGRKAVVDQDGDPVFALEFDKYPHLFQKLEWWEERLITDMPDYVKVNAGPVFKIKEWDMKNRQCFSNSLKAYPLFFEVIKPATRTEYDTFNSQAKLRKEGDNKTI